MVLAWNIMSRIDGKTIDKKLYEKLKIEFSKRNSKPRSKELIEKISGKNSGSWKGYYITPKGKYETLIDARKALNNMVSIKSISDWCQNPDKIISGKGRKSKFIKECHIGKTYGEIGFNFITVNKPKKKPYNQLAENNPLFKGYYITPLGKFATAKEAAKVCNVSSSSIRKWCKNNKIIYKVKSKRKCPFSNGLEDQTYEDLGFSFSSIDSLK